jgi:hypothetical protein
MMHSLSERFLLPAPTGGLNDQQNDQVSQRQPKLTVAALRLLAKRTLISRCKP